MFVHVFYPIHIDRWRSPIATLLREIAIRSPSGFRFYSFSKPETNEDKELGWDFWRLNHITRLRWPWETALYKFDVVHHASATPRNFLAAKLAKKRGAVHVFTANVEPHFDDRYLRWYERSVQACDVLIAVSKAVANSVEHWFGRRADAIIPNGVDIEFFSRSKAGRNSRKKPYVLFCAVLEHRKRPDIFLQLAERMPDLTFVLVGGYHRSKERVAKQYLEKASRLPNVKYLGRQPRTVVRDLMAEAEALIFPSEVEGLPLTVLESLAMGLPVLAQPKSSLPEVVIPGKTGWLLDGDSLNEWELVLREILKWNTEEKEKFGCEARRFVVDHFSWDVIASQYRGLYLQCAEKNRA